MWLHHQGRYRLGGLLPTIAPPASPPHLPYRFWPYRRPCRDQACWQHQQSGDSRCIDTDCQQGSYPPHLPTGRDHFAKPHKATSQIQACKIHIVTHRQQPSRFAPDVICHQGWPALQPCEWRFHQSCQEIKYSYLPADIPAVPSRQVVPSLPYRHRNHLRHSLVWCREDAVDHATIQAMSHLQQHP